MSDEAKLKALAALAGGWENLAKQLWKQTPKRERGKAIKRITPPSEPTESERFQWSTMQARRRGPKVKYNRFGLGAVYLALDYMQLHNIGNTDKTGRVKLLVAYINAPKQNRITGLAPSIREMLTDEYAYNIAPVSDTPDEIAKYIKYLGAQRPAYDRMRKLSATLNDDLTAHVGADYGDD